MLGYRAEIPQRPRFHGFEIRERDDLLSLVLAWCLGIEIIFYEYSFRDVHPHRLFGYTKELTTRESWKRIRIYQGCVSEILSPPLVELKKEP